MKKFSWILALLAALTMGFVGVGCGDGGGGGVGTKYQISNITFNFPAE